MDKMECEIVKKKGIEGLVSEYSPKKVEEEKVLQEVGGGKFAELLEQYKQFEDPVQRERYVRETNFDFVYCTKDILTPEEINTFLLLSAAIETDDPAGVFSSRLIQNSYRSGYYDFVFKVSNQEVVLGRHLAGSRKNPLRMKVTGNLAATSLAGAEYIDVTLEGSLGDMSIWNSDSSTFFFDGPVGKNIGSGAFNCTFKTSKRQILADLIYWIPPEVKKFKVDSLGTGGSMPSLNKIIFVEDGKEEVVKNYGL